MRNIIKLLTGGLVAGLAMPGVFAANTWDGGGTGTSWATPENWDDNLVPASGADVTFGSGFASGANPILGGNRTVGMFTWDYTDGLSHLIQAGNTLTINTGISKTAATGATTADIFSMVSLPGNIVINQASAGRIGFRGGVTGAGKITANFTSVAATSLFFDGNNTTWSGGLDIGAAPANSGITVNSSNALGTGTVTWTSAATSPAINLSTDINYTLVNNFSVLGDKTINLSATSTNRTVAFNGNLDGTGAATIRFAPRLSGSVNLKVELNNANTNTNAASRLVFAGSSNGALGGIDITYLVGNNNALDWGAVLLGNGTASVEDMAFLYKDDITITKLLSIGVDGGGVTLGVTGANASANHNAGITVNNSMVRKVLNFSAETGSVFTATGALTSVASGTLVVTKVGSGTVALNNAAGNAYYGTTTVSEGTLLVNNEGGSGTGSGPVTVASGATLGGSARFAPTAGNLVTINGTLSPGNSPGTMQFNLSGASKLVFGTGSTLAFELGTISDLVDFVTVGNWLDGSGNAVLALTLGSGFSYDATYTIFSDVTTANFTFASITGFDDLTYDAVFALNGTNYELSFVPEPGPVMLISCAGFVLVGVWLRRRKQALA